MVKFLCILSLILLSSICAGQDLAKTKTAKDITMRQDTIRKKVISQQVYKFRADSSFIKRQDSTISKLDSIIASRRKKSK